MQEQVKQALVPPLAVGGIAAAGTLGMGAGHRLAKAEDRVMARKLNRRNLLESEAAGRQSLLHEQRPAAHAARPFSVQSEYDSFLREKRRIREFQPQHKGLKAVQKSFDND